MSSSHADASRAGRWAGDAGHALSPRASLCAVLVLAVAPYARAQETMAAAPMEQPKAALLSTAGASGSQGDAALEPVIQAALEKLEVVNVTARPGMDLGAVQLAIDCVGETPACLRAVANQTGVQILIAPAIERTDKELVLTLLYFDALGDGELRRVVHRQQGGGKLDQPTLDAVPGMLRELFGLTAPAGAAPAPAPQPETATQPQEAQPNRGPSLLGPLIVGGAGVAMIGAGLVAGAVMKGTQSDYAKLQVTSKQQAQAASDKLKSGQGQARVANVLFGVGAAALALGGIWLALELGKPDETPPQTALAPVLAPGLVGLALSSRGQGL